MSIMAAMHRVSPRAAEGNQVHHHAKRLLLNFWSIMPIAPGRRPLQSKTSLGSSFLREAQEHVLKL